VDGRSIYVLETAQDHKRLLDGDRGPNTGGMGAFSPSPLIDDALMSKIQRQILVPTLDALRRDGIDYRGVLYAGLMLTPAGPKVLEFNCRFGDPECQAILPRLETDLLDVLVATCHGQLSEIDLRWTPGASCCIVLAAPGYPDTPRAGLPISGLDEAAAVEGVHVFHAGTKRDAEGRLVTAGGRVLSIVGLGADLAQARGRAYEAADRVHFEGKLFRRDIGEGVAPRR
jgi:phosphoribosylamine--glycine ligase